MIKKINKVIEGIEFQIKKLPIIGEEQTEKELRELRKILKQVLKQLEQEDDGKPLFLKSL